MNQQSLSAFIWSVADLLRGDYKQSDYGKVILPFTVLRRLDCVLEPTKAAVLAEFAAKKKAGVNPEPFLLRKAGQSFYNTSPLDMKKLMGDADNTQPATRETVADMILPVNRNASRIRTHPRLGMRMRAASTST
jgi:type I restriction-modification system DNA methylase subunit